MHGALLAVTPALAFGGYLLFVALYCYRKGEVGGFRVPGMVKRSESVPRFFFGVVWMALGGLAFIALGIYWFVEAI